ncbi:dTDP-4-dehydrorhamnose 3,5-epimerase family protein [Dokdonella sp.]|uniref:dTDP-4-dehydrorhamnose 3,5-epimerase family protein n=1 Tax=Dokdonella sp. TaxID=2291710 RepID=UPI002F40E4DD
MRLLATPLAGLTVVETAPIADERGRFVRIACEQALSTLKPDIRFVQVNLSRTLRQGTVRGLHFQHAPHTESKLIRCLRGRVFDVAVDLRTRSPTFLRWHAVELDADVEREVFIPDGFAHGFQALTDDVELLYLHTAAWYPSAEGRVRPDDPALGIAWPLAVAGLSPRDRDAPLLTAAFPGIDA